MSLNLSATEANRSKQASFDSPEAGSHQSAGTLVLVLVCLGQFIVVLDVSIGRSLGFGSTALQWVINAYNIAFGGFLLLAGRG